MDAAEQVPHDTLLRLVRIDGNAVEPGGSVQVRGRQSLQVEVAGAAA